MGAQGVPGAGARLLWFTSPGQHRAYLAVVGPGGAAAEARVGAPAGTARYFQLRLQELLAAEAPNPRAHGAKIGSLLDPETWSLLVGCGPEALEAWIALLTNRLPRLLVDAPWSPELFQRASAETTAQRLSTISRLSRAIRAGASGPALSSLPDRVSCPAGLGCEEVEAWATRWFETGWAVVGVGPADRRESAEASSAMPSPAADDAQAPAEARVPRCAAAAFVFEGVARPAAHLVSALESAYLYSGSPRDHWSRRAGTRVPFPSLASWTYRDWMAVAVHSRCDAETASLVQDLLKDSLQRALELDSSTIAAATMHRLGDLLDHPRERVLADARRLYYGAPLTRALRAEIEAMLADATWRDDIYKRATLVTAVV